MVRDPLDWEGWPQAKQLLKASVDRSDDSTMEEVEARLKANDAELWVAIHETVRLAGVTQLIRTKRCLQCFIWHLGGEWDGYADRLLGEVETWALAEGCAEIEGNMRPGFERRLKDWRTDSVVMRKVLSDG